jgi:hypothetical protein
MGNFSIQQWVIVSKLLPAFYLAGHVPGLADSDIMKKYRTGITKLKSSPPNPMSSDERQRKGPFKGLALKIRKQVLNG